MRIFFTGSQGTGKSTLVDMIMDEFPHLRRNVFPKLKRAADVTRDLVKEGKLKKENTSKGSTEENQVMIFKAYLEELSKNNIVSPRHLVDVIAYSKWLYDRGDLSQKELDSELIVTKRIALEMGLDQYDKRNLSDSNFIIYTPVEFLLEDDGMRDLDPEYQKEIDEDIKWALEELDLDYITVTGSPKERFNQILEEIYKRVF